MTALTPKAAVVLRETEMRNRCCLGDSKVDGEEVCFAWGMADTRRYSGGSLRCRLVRSRIWREQGLPVGVGIQMRH